MELLLFWGIPVIFAVLGFQRMLYRSFSKFVCFAFAVYLGMWSEKLISPIFGFLPAGAESIQPVIAIYVVAIIVFVVLMMVYSSLNPKGNHYVFPQWADRAGGALFGLLTGSILISFFGVASCLTPLKTELPLGLSAESVQKRSVSNIMTLTGGINLFTLQSGRNKACRERLDELFANADAAAADLKAKRAAYEALQRGETPPAPPAEESDGEKKGMISNVREQKEQRDQEMNK